MNNLDYVFQVICVGLAIATFLLNTGRAVKAIEVCKECLILLNNKVVRKKEEFVYLVRITIYQKVFIACCHIPDYPNATKHGKQLLDIYQERGKTGEDKGILLLTLAMIYEKQFKYAEAGKLYEEAISITREIGDRKGEAVVSGNLAVMFSTLGEYYKAKEYFWRALAITIEIGDREGEAACYGNLGTVFLSLGEYGKAKEYLEKALEIRTEICDKKGEATDCGNLGAKFQYLGEYGKAKEYHEKAVKIKTEIGDREGEAADYGNLGTLFLSLGEYGKAKEYLEKALEIRIEIGDKKGEATDYGNLGTMFHSLGEYGKAKEYLEKALAIRIKIGDREGEAADYGNLGSVFHSLGKNGKAKEYLEKALAIRIEIGDKKGEAAGYGNLGSVLESLGEYGKGKEFLEKALEIRFKIGDRGGEAADYGNLGRVFHSLGEYGKANEYLEKALEIRTKIGDKKGEASDYGNLGVNFQPLGEYDKAIGYLNRALAMTKEIGDREGEAVCYGNLGNVFQHAGEYDTAKEYYDKALAIKSEIGGRKGESTYYVNLGTVFESLGEYEKSKEKLDKALAIAFETDDRAGEANCYGNLGTVFQSLGEYEKAEHYFQKGLVIRKEIGDRAGEAADYMNLYALFYSIGEPVIAEGYLEKALSISQDIGDRDKESKCLCEFTIAKIIQGKIQEALVYMVQSIEKSESLHDFLRDNDQFKISFLDIRSFPYRIFAAFLVRLGNPNKALYVEELSRARALADLMASRYSVERQVPGAHPLSWIGIENIMKHESNCSCLYISNFDTHIFLWTLKTSGAIHFRIITVNKSDIFSRSSDNLDDFFAKSFQSFGISPEENCEDRSLNEIDPKPDVFQSEELATSRQGRHKNDFKLNLALFYNIIIAPVADLLKGSEIIIVPDRHLYHVPFPALLDDSGKYLSEKFRIRIVPSLTTLKWIQDFPADYYSQCGVLIVGDPEVGMVRFNGGRKTFKPLPFARREAEMIGRLLGVQPLLGAEATKQAVLQKLHSAGLIHFAAHGDAERGEIVLSPVRSTGKIPKEHDYLLTMSDVLEVELRAKLVVLSCCHSGRGKIRAEGVIGISRGFLGSGARSVLVALWALDDEATEQFMSRFYEHLVRGESTSECLHQAMEWMRGNGWPEVRQWAPFMLMGDNVTFEFGK